MKLSKDLKKLENEGYEIIDLGDGNFRVRTPEYSTWSSEELENPIPFNDEEDVYHINLRDQPTLDDYLDGAIYNTGFNSDRELAKAIGVSHSSVNNWRRGMAFPKDEHMIKLCEFACCDAFDAILMLNIWRSKKPELKATYKRILDGIYHITGQNLGASDFDDYLINGKKSTTNLLMMLGVSLSLFSSTIDIDDDQAPPLTSAKSPIEYILW